MRNRDVWLFATLGWDPTRQRRVPRRIKIVWTVALMLIGSSFAVVSSAERFAGGVQAEDDVALLVLRSV